MTDLTGKGKPFHSALDKAAALLKRKVGTGQEFMQELKGLGGIKQAEMEERKLADLMGMPKMTHEQFMAELASRPLPAIQEKVLGASASDEEIKKMATELAFDHAVDYLREEEGMTLSQAKKAAREMAQENYLEHMDEAREELAHKGEAPFHGEYTLPGGENYREMLIKAPQGAEQFGGVGAHFGGEGGILASMRLKDRLEPVYGPEQIQDIGSRIAKALNVVDHKNLGSGAPALAISRGAVTPEEAAHYSHHRGFQGVPTANKMKKLLHLEELQSDWHQKGREKGYNTIQNMPTMSADELLKKHSGELTNAQKDYLKKFESRWDEAQESENDQAIDNLTNEYQNWTKSQSMAGVPDAPFKKNWEEVALKRLLHHAAEKGYHGIVMTPGIEQAKRYNLGNQLHSIQLVSPNKESLQDSIFNGYPKEGTRVINRLINTPEELHELVGKETAEKLMQQKHEKGKEGNKGAHIRKLEGVDLEVGGEGMKAFYDKKVPNILNAIGKKHGVKTQLHGHHIETRPAKVKPQIAAPGIGHFPEPITEPAQTKAVHHFPITEDMRKDILTNGLPLYADGGIIRKAEGGNVQLSVEQMRQQLMYAGKGLPDISQIGANEAPNMPVKGFVVPNNGATGPMPMGGVDMNPSQPGQQMLPANALQPNPLMPQQPQAPEGAPAPLGGNSNILQMTPQGQAMAAMQPQAPVQKAVGGTVGNLPMPVQNRPFMSADDRPIPFMAKVGGSDNAPMNNDYSDNGATDFDIDNIQQLAKGGQAKKPLHYEPSPSLSKAEINAMAERMVRQMAGQDNPNKKTLQQLAREQNLPIGIKSSKKMDVPIINYEDLKDAYSVGVPGDTSRGGVKPSKGGMGSPKAGEYLTHIGGEKLDQPVGLFGGKDYGAFGHPAGWASDLGASAGMFNVVKKLAEENPEREVYGHYHKMSPEALNHAVHMLDAVISHHKPHASPAERIAMLNDLMRNQKTTTSKHDVPYPEFPGFENPADIMLQGQLNSGMRKKIIGLLGKEKYFPGGKQKLDDIIYAISHPELRNIETGAGGSAIIKFDPTRNLKESMSPHPTYGHDIPSKLAGRTRYLTPAELLAPRSMHNAKREIAAMGKKVVPFNQAKMNIIREPIDEQYINQMGEYEMAMKKRLGYKKGGSAKTPKVADNLDTMRLALTRNKKAK